MKNGLLWKNLAFLFIFFTGLLSNTCKNPVGLGSIIDTSAPVVRIITDHGTGPGAYLNGTATIYIDATDDSGVASVTATYTYSVYKDDNDGQKTIVEEQSPVKAAIWNKELNCYTVTIDTTTMADGTLILKVTATDTSGKVTTTPDLIYTVKNQPPTINMQIPRPRTLNGDFSNSDPYPSVVTDTYLMGVFEDLAGLAPGYPWIKFWRSNQPEPTAYNMNAGWSNVSGYDSPQPGWLRADDGAATNERGEKGGSFKYFLRERQPDGTPFDEESNNSLMANVTYNLKIIAADINGITMEWPRDAYNNAPEYMTLELVASGFAPIISIHKPTTEQIYLRDDFTIQASSVPHPQGDLDTDIVEMYLEVSGKDSEGKIKPVTLARWEAPDVAADVKVDFTVELGAVYYSPQATVAGGKVDSEADVPPDAYSFVTFHDGSYNFTIIAVGNAGSRGRSQLSLYVDRQPPKTDVTSVSPNISQDNITLTAAIDAPNNNIHDYVNPVTGNPAPDPYRRWTVNSTIGIGVNSTDNRGNAVDTTNGCMKFKYLFFKDSDINESDFTVWKGSDTEKTFGEFLYTRPNAEFLDYTKANPIPLPDDVKAIETANNNPLIKVEGSDGAYTLFLQTHCWDVDSWEYKLWFYIVAMDNAENISYQKILLNVDQKTDMPKIEFGEFNSFMNDKSNIRINIKDDDGLPANAVEYRFAKNDADKATYNSDSELGWAPLNGELSIDELSMTIEMTLQKIACDRLSCADTAGHTMDSIHSDELGVETEQKYIQIRAHDDITKKLYDTDWVMEAIHPENTDEWMPFYIDLKYPVIKASTKDLDGLPLTGRNDSTDSFGAPRKDGAYKEFEFAYGDIIEINLKSITFKINGHEDFTRTYEIGTDPVYSATAPAGNDFAVWRTVQGGAYNGELRWRIPMASFFADLDDGSHTFEISFEDKASQIITRSLTFYKDTQGPSVSVISPGNKIYLDSGEVLLIEENDFTQDLQDKYDAIVAMVIKGADGRLMGNFTDDFSFVNDEYWYKIDDGSWTRMPITTASKSAAWQIPLAGLGLNDGIHRLSIRVMDTSGNGYNNAAPQPSGNTGYGYETNLAFMMDLNSPEILVSAKDINGGDIVRTADNPFIAPEKDKSYTSDNSIEFAYGDLKEWNLKTVKIQIDGAAKTRTYPIDTVPAYSAAEPAGDAFAIWKTSAADPWNGELRWRIPMADFFDDGHADYLQDGSHTFEISFEDIASQITTKSLVFVKDTEGPAISFINPAKEIILSDTELAAINNNDIASISGLQEKYDDMISNVIKNISTGVSGNFFDNISAIDNEFWYKFDGGAWTSVDITPVSGTPSKNIAWNIPLTNEGIHRLSIKVKDVSGNESLVENIAFMVDSAPPLIVPSATDLAGNLLNGTLTRTEANPFISPEKDMYYSAFTFASGDLIERNLKSITIKIDGVAYPASTYDVPAVIPVHVTGQPAGTASAVWKTTDNPWSGELRWRIQLSSIFPTLEEGTHTFEIIFEDWASQLTTKSLIFLKDMDGPDINLTAPRDKIYLNDTEYANLTNPDYNLSGDAALRDKYDSLKNMIIRDGTLKGNFSDSVSAIFSSNNQGYSYRINGGAWVNVTIPAPSITTQKTVGWTLNLTDLNDGIYRISIRIKDATGNGFGITPADDSAIAALGTDGGPGFETNLAFILDRAIPVIVPSAHYPNGTAIPGGDMRDSNNPFITPEHEGFYQEFNFAYGDIVERSLRSITVKIDGGGTDRELVYMVPETLDTSIISNGEVPVVGDGFAVWKTESSSWNGELRWRVPMGKFFNEADPYYLQDGSHTFEISFEDWAGQITTKSVIFTKDTDGPEISLIIPGVNDTNWVYANSVSSITAPSDIAKLIAVNIKDPSINLTGSFTDRVSPIGDKYWYMFDNDGTWVEAPISNLLNSRSVAWNIPIPATMQDGIHLLSLRVMDSTGNGYSNVKDPPAATPSKNRGNGYITNVAFMLDCNPPVLEITEVKNNVTGTVYTDELSNPIVPSFINNNFTIKGTLSGTIAIKKLSFKLNGTEYSVTSYGTSGYITLEPHATLDRTFDFSIDVPAATLSEASHSIMITATGASDMSAVDVHNFTFDKTAPSVQFNAPSIGTRKEFGNLSNNGKYEIWWSGVWVTGTVKVGGISDDKSGVTKIYYHLGKLGTNPADGADDAARETLYDGATWTDTLLDTDTPISNWSGGLYYWNYQDNLNPYQFSPGMIETGVDSSQTHTANTFYLPLYVKAVDRAGNITIIQYKVYVDPDMDIPSASIVNPNDGVRVGGEVRISGIASDNNWVHSVDIRIIDTTKTPGSPGYYYKNPEDSWYDQANGWIKAKIMGDTDMLVNWYYNVNGDGKLNPDPGMIERQVKVQVRAWDTKDTAHQMADLVSGPSTAYTYYFDSGVPTIGIPLIEKTGTPNRDYTDGIRVSGDFRFSTVVQDDGGLSSIRVRRTGNSSFTEIVKDGNVLTANLETGWNVTPPTTVTSFVGGWRYYILNPGTISNWEYIDAGWFEDKSYGPGVMIQYNGVTIAGGGYSAFQADGDQVTGGDLTNPHADNWNTQFFKYTLTFDIDSTAIAGLGYGKTGIFTLELDVYDNNQVPGPYNTRGTYNLLIDNFYPTTEITSQYNAATKNYYVQGIARDYDDDSGSILGLERVLVYFEKNGTFYNARKKTAGNPDSFYSGGGSFSNFDRAIEWGTIPAMGTWPKVRDMTLSPTGKGPNVDNFSYFPKLQMIIKDGGKEVWESPHAMVIDSQELIDNRDTDGDGTFAEQWVGNVDRIWQARLDTTEFDDGPLTVHYIVMDRAGNATHYAEDIYIGNNSPLIRSINLGTDIKGQSKANTSYNLTPWTNSNNPGDYLRNDIVIAYENKTVEVYNEYQTDFRVRNNRFGIRLDTLFGNGTKRYRINYVTLNSTPIASTAMVRGTVYTIADSGEGDGATEWKKYGALSIAEGTTFVASGPARHIYDENGIDITTGTVYAYTNVAGTGTAMSGNFAPATPDLADNIQFNNFTNMPDTAGKTYDANNNMNLLHDKRFIIKVYDSTVSGGAEDEQLSHVILINVDFDNQDTQKPIISINPFKWVSAADNSLYLNSKNNGHIELEADLPATFTTGGTGINDRDPKVSGKVSFRGTAIDNNIIESIYFRIDKHTQTSANTIKEPLVTGPDYYRAANFTAGAWDVPVKPTPSADAAAAFNANGWRFVIEDETLDTDGHRIDWRLDFDSTFVTNVANMDCLLTVIATDAAATPNRSNTRTWNASYQTTAATPTEHYRFDVVPYITGIETALRNEGGLKNNNIRSADGKYSIIQGTNGAFITVKGFNLNPITGGVRTQTTAEKNTYAGNPGSTTLQGTIRAFGSVAADRTSFTMTNQSNSGYLTVWSGIAGTPIGSLNNINNNESLGSYKLKLSTDNDAVGTNYVLQSDKSDGSDEENMSNREADRYRIQNITFTDDRYLQFFNVKSTQKTGDVGVPSYPVMIMNNDNPVFGYLNTSGGPTGGLNNATTTTGDGAGSDYPSYAWPQRREVNGGSGAEVYTEYLIKSSFWDGMGMAKDDSGRFIHATTFARDGGTFHLVYDRFAELFANGSGWGTGISFGANNANDVNHAHQANNNAFAMETVRYQAGAGVGGTTGTLGIFRYQYPKIIARGNSQAASSHATYHMVYFDEITKELLLRHFRIGTDVAANNATVANATNRMANRNYTTASAAATGTNGRYRVDPPVDLSSRAYNTSYTTITAENNANWTTNAGSTNNGWNTGRHQAVATGSKWFDFDVTAGNNVVLVYYDESVSKLRLRYSAAADGSAPNTNPGWTTSGIDFPEYIGMYVSAVLDGNALHIAALDANESNLVYIYVPNYSTSVTGDIKTVTIDNFGNVGSWAQVKLGDNPNGGTMKVPFISYFNLSEVGTRDSLRVAYFKNKDSLTNISSATVNQLRGVDKNGYTTGNWEYMTMPSLNPPQGGAKEFQRVNLGFRSSDSKLVLGYLSDKALEFGYPIGE